MARAKLMKLLSLLSLCNQFIFLYTVSATIFSQLPAGFQFLMATTLQVLKIWIEQTEWVEAQLHWPRNDLAALHVATNSQLFHQLFTAACFQTSKSTLTLFSIVFLGVLQDSLAVHAIRKCLERVKHLRRHLVKSNNASQASVATLHGLVLAWRTQTQQDLHNNQVPVASSCEEYRRRATRLLANSQIRDLKMLDLSQDEIQYVEQLTQVYHCRELVLLRMYMDIFASSSYFIVVAGIRHSPNAPYRGFLGTAGHNALFWRIGSQIGARCLPFVILLWYSRDPTHPTAWIN